jgi:cell division protease FtsH
MSGVAQADSDTTVPRTRKNDFPTRARRDDATADTGEQFELFEDLSALAPQIPDNAAAADTQRKQGPRNGRRIDDARRAIVAVAFEAATTAAVRRRLGGEKSVSVVVHVPGKSWVKPVEDYFRVHTMKHWETFARDGTNRTHDKNSVGNEDAAGRLSRGLRVVGIAPNPEVFLPSALVAASDIVIKIPSPTGDVVRAALRLCLRGRLPPRIDDGVVAGLDLEDIVAAMRRGSTPMQAVERLRSASERRCGRQNAADIPRLQTAVEYGAAREWGLSLAQDLDDYRAGRITWDKIDRGAVIHSAPGIGKSVFAGSISQACGVPLIRTSVAEYFARNEGNLGDVIKAQRAVFELASSLAPCILFIDEIDAMPNRSRLSSRHADWWLPIINDFLILLDGAVAAQREGVIVIGATNRIESVDPALMRPGRLERAIEIGRPDLQGIINILRFHLRPDLEGEDVTEIARLAEGSTAAELMEIVRGARRNARRAQRALALDDLKMEMHGAKDEPPALLRRLAVHEAAHAVIAVVLAAGELDYVTLRSRGRSGGHTKVSYPDEDLSTLRDIEDRVTSGLAASVAERVLLGAVSTGSGGDEKSDLGVATALLAIAHASTCLAGNLFHLSASEDALTAVRADPALRRKVERHLRKIEKRAIRLVELHRDGIAAVAVALAARRHLTGEEVVAILRKLGTAIPADATQARTDGLADPVITHKEAK